MSRSKVISLALTWQLAVLALASPVCAASSGYATLSHSGFWNLRSLSGANRLAFDGRGAGPTISYRLPENARQGPHVWYALHLRARLNFPGDAQGEYILSAATEGRTAAQVTFRVGRQSISSSSLGLISGFQRRRTRQRSLTVRLDNYLQNSGVRAGLNQLRFRLDTLHGSPAVNVLLLNRSGLAVTDARPDELRLGLHSPGVVGEIGAPVKVPFRLARRGSRPDGPTSVQLTLGSGIEPSGPTIVRFPSVGSGRVGSFTVRATEPGRHSVVLRVPDRYNEPQVRVAVVGVAAHRRISVKNLAFLLAAAGIAVLAILRSRRAKVRP